MPTKLPHISLSQRRLLDRVLYVSEDEFDSWPESVQELAVSLASEIFIIRYNPFIPPERVKKSVFDRLDAEKVGLSEVYYNDLRQRLGTYWQEFLDDQRFKDTILERLRQLVPNEHIVAAPKALVECSTDATDLRLEIPLLMLSPASTEEIQAIVRLAGELGFALVPRGGGSGLTGGAVPAHRHSVILSLSRMKTIFEVNAAEQTLCAQAGVITLTAMQAAAKKDMLFTVDPASKAASSLGGNISENAGGPFAFEYGTTLDNIYSYKMVLPDGALIEVRRRDHPWRKILAEDTAIFDIYAEDGSLTDSVALGGEEIRATGLGKDVSNKFLGGLPGVQKEGVDGIITEACFTLHPKLEHSRTLCLEFFGRSMRNAMLVINDLVGLRDTIRREGDLVKMASLEEFGAKYVQAIEYTKKSERYEGEPISVLLLQLDANDIEALDAAVANIVNIAEAYDKVDVFVAGDAKEAEHFWEDRHKLSAIAKHTSGFKINEDVVIPLEAIPEFSDFLEELNLYYLARAYRRGLHAVNQLNEIDPGDEFIQMELDITSRILKHTMGPRDIAEQELQLQISYFFRDLRSRYPDLDKELRGIRDTIFATRVVIANHMHAGDGNCHVNFPVNSNDPQMLHEVEEAVDKVFKKVLALNGGVSGEHGIGITKINYLQQEKLKALRAYKREIDPHNTINPGKLMQNRLETIPYTFSFNRLIQDIDKTALPQKERLIPLLRNIQTCTRCGKCKQVCPMFYPEKGFLYHPRSKNITLGALIEALYYSLMDTGEPDPDLMQDLRELMEHCTACGKCMTVCPVKIRSHDVALNMRSFLEEKGAGGHPLKSRVLNYLGAHPERVPQAAKMAALGQSVQNKAAPILPASWRSKRQSPLLRGPGPALQFKNLPQALHLEQGSLFVPAHLGDREEMEAVVYFPGCGGSLFYRSIGLATMALLLASGTAVVMPPHHMCCGYPLLAAGCKEAYTQNRERVGEILRQQIRQATNRGLRVEHMLTACGTCRESLEDFGLESALTNPGTHLDALQFLLQRLPSAPSELNEVLYHVSCHAEFTGVAGQKAAAAYATALGEHLDTAVRQSPGCCGESGLGALTSPQIYNTLRERKVRQLTEDFGSYPAEAPILVGCPSCKVGLNRINVQQGWKREILHATEFLAQIHLGRDWMRRTMQAVKKGRPDSRERRQIAIACAR
ncbi:MAG: FAD-binding and (Fe-S)-binding domain-containing protein [Thermodesulfobacteriota bacterium]